MTQTYRADVTSETTDLVLGGPIATDTALPTAATAYKRGDLLVISAAGVLTHAVAGQNLADWHVICLADVSGDQADAAIADDSGVPVYTGGEFNVAEVTINGVALTATQQKQAAAHAMRSLNNIQLRAVA